LFDISGTCCLDGGNQTYESPPDTANECLYSINMSAYLSPTSRHVTEASPQHPLLSDAYTKMRNLRSTKE
jgi:hypothetical protein